MTDEDHSYCGRYYNDPEISDLLDEYIDCIGTGLAGVLIDKVPAAEALPPQLDQAIAKIKAAIQERIWEEFPERERESQADRRHVEELSQERWAEIDHNMFWYP